MEGKSTMSEKQREGNATIRQERRYTRKGKQREGNETGRKSYGEEK